MHKCACIKQKRARARQSAWQNVYTHIYAPYAHVFTQNFTKIVLIVHYYVMTLSLKFHKDPSFCWGDMRKIMLNMHAIGIKKCSKFWYMYVQSFNTHVCTFLLRVRVYVHRSLLVDHYSVTSLSFKFHKDLIFRWGDICKIESCVFFVRYWCVIEIKNISILHQAFSEKSEKNP